MVVASADTGVRWTHGALRNQYRGWSGTNADNNYNWHDAIHGGGAAAAVQPCDDENHGTHTTARVGSDGEDETRSASPGREVMVVATWISAPGPEDLHRKPVVHAHRRVLSGPNADPTKRPHVITTAGRPAAKVVRGTLQTVAEHRVAGILSASAASPQHHRSPDLLLGLLHGCRRQQQHSRRL
jgi:hypothetical protein